MALEGVKQFRIFADPYYWKSALLIAKSGLAKKYHTSYLGIVWLILPSISTMLILLLMMPLMMKTSHSVYASYILATWPLWQLFSSTISMSTNSLIENSETLKRCIISSSVFPVADVFKNTYSALLSFAAMLLISLLFGASISWHIILLPIYFIPILISIMSLSVGISYITPFVRDIRYLIDVSLGMLVWASAVPYPIEAIPESMQFIVRWNPIYMILEPVINLVHDHHIPSLLVSAKLLGVMTLSLIFGYILYRIGRKNFVYYL